MTSIFNRKTRKRINRQKTAPIRVIIANPPYNAGQADENDNNKNRKYPELDQRVSFTYGEASIATLKNKLSDPYIKAIRCAIDRIGKTGIVCFVNERQLRGTTRLSTGCARNLAKDFDRDLRPRFGRQRSEESQAVRHNAQRFRHPGRRKHQSLCPAAKRKT